MYFEENKKTWESIAESFVLDNGNSNLKNFVKRVQQAKIAAERKMRSDLNNRILNMRSEKLSQIIGKNFSTKIKQIIRTYIEEEEAIKIAQMEQIANQRQASKPMEALTPLDLSKMKSSRSLVIEQTQIKPRLSTLTSLPEKRTVQFAQIPTVPKEPIFEKGNYDGENREEILLKVKELRKHISEVEKRIPLLAQEQTDELGQLKFFLLTYYKPILSTYEFNALNTTSAANLQEQLKDKNFGSIGRENDDGVSSILKNVKTQKDDEKNKMSKIDELTAKLFHVKRPGSCSKNKHWIS